MGFLRFLALKVLGRGATKAVAKQGLKQGAKGLTKAAIKQTAKTAAKKVGKTMLLTGGMSFLNAMLQGTGINANSLVGFGKSATSMFNNPTPMSGGSGGNGVAGGGNPTEDEDDSQAQSPLQSTDSTEPSDSDGSETGIMGILQKILRNTERDYALTRSILLTTNEELNKTISTNFLLKKSSEYTETSLDEIDQTTKDILDSEKPQKELAELQLKEATKQNSDFFGEGEDGENEEGEGGGGGNGGGGLGGLLDTAMNVWMAADVAKMGWSAIKAIPSVAGWAANGLAGAGVVGTGLIAAAVAGMAGVVEGAAGNVKAARLKAFLPQDGNTWDDRSWSNLLNAMDEKEKKIYEKHVKPYLDQLKAINHPEAEMAIYSIRKQWYDCLYNLRLKGATNAILIGTGDDNPYVRAQLSISGIYNLPQTVADVKRRIAEEKADLERSERIENRVSDFKSSGKLLDKNSQQYKTGQKVAAWQNALHVGNQMTFASEEQRKQWFYNHIPADIRGNDAQFDIDYDKYVKNTDGGYRFSEQEEIAVQEYRHSVDTRSAERTARENEKANRQAEIFDGIRTQLIDTYQNYKIDESIEREEALYNLDETFNPIKRQMWQHRDDMSRNQLSELQDKYAEYIANLMKRIGVTMDDCMATYSEGDPNLQYLSENDIFERALISLEGETRVQKDAEKEDERRRIEDERRAEAERQRATARAEFEEATSGKFLVRKKSEDDDFGIDDLQDSTNVDDYYMFDNEEDALQQELQQNDGELPWDRYSAYSRDLLIKYGVIKPEEPEETDAEPLEDMSSFVPPAEIAVSDSIVDLITNGGSQFGEIPEEELSAIRKRVWAAYSQAVSEGLSDGEAATRAFAEGNETRLAYKRDEIDPSYDPIGESGDVDPWEIATATDEKLEQMMKIIGEIARRQIVETRERKEQEERDRVEWERRFNGNNGYDGDHITNE